MKTLMTVLISATLFAACGGGDAKKETTTSEGTAEKKAPDLSSNPDYKAGLALIGESDCLTCHQIGERLVGPSYREVANKYANAGDTIVNYLAGRIIKGGNGVWGEAMMTPHPSLSQADAETMSKYVLLLKN